MRSIILSAVIFASIILARVAEAHPHLPRPAGPTKLEQVADVVIPVMLMVCLVVLFVFLLITVYQMLKK